MPDYAVIDVLDVTHEPRSWKPLATTKGNPLSLVPLSAPAPAGCWCA